MGYVIRSKVRTNPLSYMGPKESFSDMGHPFGSLENTLVFPTYEDANMRAGSNSEVLSYEKACKLEAI